MFRSRAVSAQASVVLGETVPDQVDNTFINGTVQITWSGDVDGNGSRLQRLIHTRPFYGDESPLNTHISNRSVRK